MPPALVFLVPVSLVAAELARAWPGGVYNWVSQGISAPMGLLAVWCEFAQTIFLDPALLAYVADTLAYPFDPGLAANGVYTAVVIVVLFWGGVLLCSLGPALVAKLGSRGTGIGTLIPAVILLALGVAYLVQGHHPDAPMTARHLLPPWSGVASIVLVVNSFFTYAGVEVNAVHVNELRNPAREYPRSIFLAMALVLAIFIGPTLVISWVVPARRDQLHRRRNAGLQRPVHSFRPRVRGAADRDRPGGRRARRDDRLAGRPVRGSAADRAPAGVPPALVPEGQPPGHRGPHHRRAGRRDHPDRRAVRVHPQRLARLLDLHRAGHAGVPDHVRADVHRRGQAAPLATGSPPRGYRAPALGLLCVLGAVSSVAALVIGFIPPSQFGHSDPLTYALLILAGPVWAIGIVPPLLMDRLRRLPAGRRRATGQSGVPDVSLQDAGVAEDRGLAGGVVGARPRPGRAAVGLLAAEPIETELGGYP